MKKGKGIEAYVVPLTPGPPIHWNCPACGRLLGKVYGNEIQMMHGRQRGRTYGPQLERLPVKRWCVKCQTWQVYPPDTDPDTVEGIWFPPRTEKW